MLVLMNLMFIMVFVTAFNPMDLYVDENEGFSLAYEDDGTKYLYYVLFGYQTSYGASYKNLAIDSYTRMKVGPPKGNNVYPITSYAYLQHWDELNEYDERDVKIYSNNDGTVSLKCVDNGLFARRYDGVYCKDCSVPPLCTEPGICPECRFNLVNGAISDIQIQLVDLTWGDSEEPIPSSPEQVDEDNQNNYSNTTTSTTLTVKFEGTTTDKTIWEHAWGFELSVSAEVDVDIPFIGGGSVTTTATASYDGKYGTEHTMSNTQSYQNSKTVECPPMTRCTLKVVASKLDDFDMPFTALVERTQDEGPPLQWEETGIWRGVQAFNFDTVYCTTSLETGDTNCPNYKWMD